jgi:hypothetical protein
LAIRAQQGRNALRKWYAAQEPTEAQLRELFESKRDSLYPSRKVYTFMLWSALVSGLDKSTTASDGRAKLESHLNAVYQAVAAEKPQTEKDAQTLFEKLDRTFAETTSSRRTRIDSVSPLIDPILERTDPGKLSLPVDNGSRVALVFMIAQDQEPARFDEAKASVRQNWRKERFQEHVLQLSKELKSE